MKIAPGAGVKARFNKYREECVGEPVVVTKNGRPAAALVAVSNEDALGRLVLAHIPRFTALLDAAEDRIRRSGGIQHEDFWKAASERRP